MGTPAIQQDNLALANPPADFYSLLHSLTLFQDANEEALQFVAQHLERVVFNKGDCIILENEQNEFVYFVECGSVEIVSYLADDKRIQRLVLIKQGGHFAEFSALTKTVRSGSAYASEDSVLLRISGQNFMELLEKFPSVSARLVKLLGELSVRMEQAREVVPFYLPSQLNVPSELASLLPVASWKRYSIIPALYQAGLLTIIMKDQNNPQFLQYMKTSFPQYEIAIHLISDQEFDAALTFAQVAVKSTTRTLQPAHETVPLEPLEALHNADLFRGLSDDLIAKILPYVKRLESKAGTKIFTPDKEIDSYLLLVKGKINVLRPLSEAKLMAPVLTVNPGEGFGEVYCLFGGKSPYVVRASEDSIIYALPKAVLIELLKLPEFLVCLAQTLAHHLQRLGHIRGLHNYKGDDQLNYPEIQNLLPMPVIEEHKLIPLKVIDGEVLLGLVNPDSSGIFAVLGRYLREQRIKLFAINEDQFNKWSSQLKQAKSTSAGEALQANAPVTAIGKTAPPPDVIKLTESLLIQGMNSRASDIHFEPSDLKLNIRYRVDGVLQESGQNFPLDVGREVVSRLKLISHMDISQQHIPQDGQLKTEIGGLEIVARASSIPIRAGEKMVLRLIRPQNGVVPLSMLAPDRRVINILQSIAKCRQGLFLVCGPTGSGKTTTLYSLLSSINHVTVNVTTLEDPVEMEIPGLNQIEVDRKRGLDFSMALRSVLRQDPNIIMVGEIRDAESAKIVFEAAHTGHLVLSTLHTNSSLDVPARLKELGVNTAIIADGLLGVLSQRLLRANCRRCLADRPTTAQEQELLITLLNIEPPAMLKQGKGCPACQGTGYHDRIPVFEVWRNTLNMQQVLLDHGSPEQLLKAARQDKFDTLLEFSLKMVLSGLTSMDEVKRVLSASLF